MKHFLFLPILLIACLTYCLQVSCEEAQTQTQDVVKAQKQFEDLPPELREKARSAGYKEGDMVTLGEDTSGGIFVVPSARQMRTPDQMKAKLMDIIVKKIVRKPDDDMNIRATISPEDGSGYFTVQVDFKNLKDPLQDNAKQLGYKKGDEVPVQVDNLTWDYKVAPKGKGFNAMLLETIPSKEPGGKPSFKMAAKLADLSLDLKQKAEVIGYQKDETVKILVGEDGMPQILPRPKEGSVFIGNLEIVPVNKAKVWLMRWDVVTDSHRDNARSKGYQEGDRIGFVFSKDAPENKMVSPVELRELLETVDYFGDQN